MFCNKCGTDNPDEAVFCSSCGNNMKQNNNSGRLKLEKVPEDNVTESVTNEDGDSQDTTDSPVTDAKKADATDGVTESLTPDMIPDTFKEKEEKQLAQIVAEMRAENKQAVPKKGWYIYSLMSAIPVAGFIFFAAKKREKNENKKNFAKAGFVINLILSLVIIITAGVILYFSFGGKITLPKKHTEKVTEAAVEETKAVESSAAQTTSANASSGTAQQTSPVKKTEPVKSYSYDKNSKTFTFELNGNTFKYPVSAAAIKDLGYIYVSNTLSSETTTLDMYTDAYKSTIMVKYNAKAGNTSDCYALAAELKEGSTFMGLSARTDYAALKEAFKNADREVQTDYRSDTGTGIIQYMFGDRRISVTMDNGYVTGATIE